MFGTYTTILGLTIVTNLILISLVWENNRFKKGVKKTFFATACLICISAVSEWGGVALNGAPEQTMGVHGLLKCSDYIFTPLIAFFLIRLLDENRYLWRFTLVLQVVNVLLELTSLFTGWTYYVDSANVYHHGPYHVIYIAIYVLTYGCCFASFIRYGAQFKKHNTCSLGLIYLLIIAGIAVQEIGGDAYRISYLAIAIGVAFMYVHYSEFYQQRNDEFVDRQDRLLRTDPLTQLLNRYSYIEEIKCLEDHGVKEQLVVFSVDINGLKVVNDTYGHMAGDELIVGAAQVLQSVLGAYGNCYRTGGDEYICIVEMPEGEVSAAKRRMMALAARWRGKYQPDLFLAVGYAKACENLGKSIDELVIISDEMMYLKKKQFHLEHKMELR